MISVDRHAGAHNGAIAFAYTLTEIACYFGIHLSRASRIARRTEDKRNKT